jgi:hypothetical protein
MKRENVRTRRENTMDILHWQLIVWHFSAETLEQAMTVKLSTIWPTILARVLAETIVCLSC